MRKILVPLLISCSFSAGFVQAENFSEDIKVAMKSENRSDKDKERDRNRKPIQTLEFLGIQSDMSVLELIPGSGWYTTLLAPALKEKGLLYVAIGAEDL
ncbi:MAG: putative methyltransferase, partial [Colwellia sp.]